MVREEMAASRAEGRVPTVWGAKITGGGSGGTVCILGEMEDREKRTASVSSVKLCFILIQI